MFRSRLSLLAGVAFAGGVLHLERRALEPRGLRKGDGILLGAHCVASCLAIAGAAVDNPAARAVGRSLRAHAPWVMHLPGAGRALPAPLGRAIRTLSVGFVAVWALDHAAWDECAAGGLATFFSFLLVAPLAHLMALSPRNQ